MVLNDHLDTFAVIDIGSNSIRLVIFDVTDGYPHPLYNERVFCALGSGVGADGSLPKDSIEMALSAIERLVHVARISGAKRLEAFATSAVRDAVNGDLLLSAIRERTQCPVAVLAGEDEARLAAEAVVLGLHLRNGIVADLGGGSLELARIGKGKIRDMASLPLGTIRLMAKTRNHNEHMAREVSEQLGSLSRFFKSGNPTLILVGGAWRALARLIMGSNDHPLKIIHGYGTSVETAQGIARHLVTLDDAGCASLPASIAKRRTTMPATGLILLNLLDRLQVRRLMFSGVGVREGYVRARLSPRSAGEDPLLVGARALARREGRYGDTTEPLMTWLEPLFPGEKAGTRRVHAAVCALSDVAWREHPDYRASQAFERFLHHPLPGIRHPERVFIASALHTRYGGKSDDTRRLLYSGLLSRRAMRRAEILGHALHLAYRISAGHPALLGRSDLRVRNRRLSLSLPNDGTAPHLSRVERIFRRLCNARQHRPGTITIRGTARQEGPDP